MNNQPLQLSSKDADKLKSLIEDQASHSRSFLKNHLDLLQTELDRMEVLDPETVPKNVVSMNSTLEVMDLDSGETFSFTVVWPEDSDPDANRFSVLAPLGMAVLGYSEGSTVEWPVPAGVRRLKILKLLYQPEAAGVFD